MKFIDYEELDVYKIAFKSAMLIFQFSETFPKWERYSLTDQVRRSSRSVCANIAEAFYRRRYPKNFSAHLSDSIAEAAETRVWINFAVGCGYLSKKQADSLLKEYSRIIGKLIVMNNQTDKWCI
jgi:four helix bundle protein